MSSQRSIFICTFILLMTIVSVSLVWAQTPGQIVVQTINDGLKILNNPSLQSLEKMPERRQKLWEAVKAVFSFEETAKRALGRHWNERTIDEKREFIEIFKSILKNIYLEKSDSYAQENIIYLNERVKGNRSKIYTNFISNDGKKFAVDFSMKIIDNEWKIYDIIIEGVSIVGNYRSQFNSILSKSSFAQLMEKLKKKESEMEGI